MSQNQNNAENKIEEIYQRAMKKLQELSMYQKNIITEYKKKLEQKKIEQLQKQLQK